MVVQHGGDQVVRCADGVEVTCEVKVDILHGDHLGIAAAGSAALDAEHRSEGRLAQGEDRVLSDLPESVRQADGSGGLSFARRRGGDGGHQDQLSVLPVRLPKELVIHFCFVITVQFKVFFVNSRNFRDLRDLFRLHGLRDLNVRHISHVVSSRFPLM